MPERRRRPAGARRQPPAPQYGGPPQGSFGQAANGQGFGSFPQGGPAPTFGQPQGNPVLTPAGMVGGVPMHLPMGPPGGPQSQIETALSLPRPDATAIWIAQQEKQKGERRNTGVLIAVVALTALCVLGIGALFYFKLRARAHARRRRTAAGAERVRRPAAAPHRPPPAAASDGRRRGARGAGPRGAPRQRGGGVGRGRRRGAPAAAPGLAAAPSKAAAKEEPGFLTIVCNPYCDDVNDQGKSLGPSPVVHLSVTPGQHRVTVRKGHDSKVISLIVVAGQVTAQRVPMK